MNTEETARSEDDALEPLYHLDENGRLRWTEEGLRTYRQRFARFGLRIETLSTFEDYRTAMRLSASAFVDDTLKQLAERAKGQPWRELLEATFTGDDEAIENARRRFETRQKLSVIGPSAASESPRPPCA